MHIDLDVMNKLWGCISYNELFNNNFKELIENQLVNFIQTI